MAGGSYTIQGRLNSETEIPWMLFIQRSKYSRKYKTRSHPFSSSAFYEFTGRPHVYSNVSISTTIVPVPGNNHFNCQSVPSCRRVNRKLSDSIIETRLCLLLRNKTSENKRAQFSPPFFVKNEKQRNKYFSLERNVRWWANPVGGVKLYCS